MSTDREDMIGQPSAVIRFYRASGAFGFLSNLFRAPLRFEGRIFPTAEHAYQFGKPSKPEVAEWLMAAPAPHLCAAAAHALLRFDVNPGWAAAKVPRMRAVLHAKFGQYPNLADKLAATGDAQLVEASTTDSFWGEGRNGTGQNVLGILLMEIRRELLSGDFTPLVVVSGERVQGIAEWLQEPASVG